MGRGSSFEHRPEGRCAGRGLPQTMLRAHRLQAIRARTWSAESTSPRVLASIQPGRPHKQTSPSRRAEGSHSLASARLAPAALLSQGKTSRTSRAHEQQASRYQRRSARVGRTMASEIARPVQIPAAHLATDGDRGQIARRTTSCLFPSLPPNRWSTSI